MKSFGPIILALMFLILAVPGLTLAQGKAGLRIVCEGEARNADVMINGKPSGSCPVDIEIPAGKVDLQVSKTDSNGVVRQYKESFSIASNSVRRIEVVRSSMNPVFDRTKDETIAWIIDKLQGEINGGQDYSGSRLYGAKVKIDEANIEIAHSTGPCPGCGPNGRASSSIFKMPINEIKQVDVWEAPGCGPKGGITFIVPKNCSSCTEVWNGSSPMALGGAASICIRNSEENLDERFKDAFQHLKRFYPQPKVRREAF